MNESPVKVDIKRLFEWIAALVGAVNCIYVPLAVNQWDFPLPSLYFVEIFLLGLMVIVFVAWRTQFNERWYLVPWIAAGIILAFVVLGGFSIGFFLIPAFLAFIVVGILADLQSGNSKAAHLAALIIAALAQSAVMYVAIRFV